jgi:hypothetical protein
MHGIPASRKSERSNSASGSVATTSNHQVSHDASITRMALVQAPGPGPHRQSAQPFGSPPGPYVSRVTLLGRLDVVDFDDLLLVA